jgi:ABC-type antimicrobial peptide transport system permease subunit
VFVMILSTRERVREIGTLKAIGASNREVVVQFLAEAVTLSGLGGLGAVLVAAVFAQVLQRALGLPVEFDGRVLGFIAVGCIVFAALGSLYPVIRGVRLSPVEAMRSV